MRDNIALLTQEYHGRIGEEIHTALMPDSLHPITAGHHLLAQCDITCVEKEDGKCAPVVSQ